VHFAGVQGLGIRGEGKRTGLRGQGSGAMRGKTQGLGIRFRV